MFSAFQTGSYQNSAYQIVITGKKTPVTTGGKPDNSASFHLSRHEYELKEFNRIQAQKRQAEEELAIKEHEIEDLELRRLKAKALSDQQMQLQLMALFVEAERLQQEKLRLEALIRRFMVEQDDIVIILMSMPFM